MVSSLSRRQAQRNELALQELLKNVPGNNECADCRARNPGWASWNLGIFLCLRCATLHRKLGTHISKVKSISMDQWGNEHVEAMKKVGNAESNKKYNPQNVRPDIPIDVDEVNGAMERFIRQKYEKKTLMEASRPGTRQNTGSTSSVEEKPPPLPPKPTKRFGLGLRSTSYQQSNSRPDSRSAAGTPPASRHDREPSPPRVNKASKVFGSNVDRSQDPYAMHMQALRTRGFVDEKRNATVLRSVNGSLERSIDVLQRLPPNPQPQNPPVPEKEGSTNGISIQRNTDPFKALDAVPEQQQAAPAHYQLSGGMPHTQSPVYSSNPFSPNMPATQSLEHTMQNMHIAQRQPQQPQAQAQQQQQQLFPHSTGGYNQSNPYQSNPFLNSFTPPPMGQVPPPYNPPTSQQAMAGHQQVQSPGTSQVSGGNPFLRSSQSQYFTPTNPFNMSNNNTPLIQQHQQMQSQNWAPAQTTSPFNQSQAYAPPQTQSPNPFLQRQQQYQQQQPQQQFGIPFQPSFAQEQAAFSQQFPYQPNNQPQQFQPPLAPRHDKASILSLYGQYPITTSPQASAPSTPSEVPNANGQRRAATMPVLTNMNSGGTIQYQPSGAVQQQPSTLQQQPTTAPAHNPFMANHGRGGMPKAADPSRESVDFQTLMASAGRHSPDAFTGLSATYR